VLLLAIAMFWAAEKLESVFSDSRGSAL
jgi:hypothetical protein